MPIQPPNTGLYEGLKLSELKSRCLYKLKQKALNYDRYSESSIEQALIDSEVEVARRKRCLRAWAITVLKDGYAQYRPPSQMIEPDKAFFYQSSTSYWELKQVTRSWLDKFKPGWRTVDGDPRYMFMGDNYGNLRKLGFYPKPDKDSGYELDSDYGAFIKTDSDGPSGNVAGLNSAAHATVCTDGAGRTLSDLGVVIGLTAVNVTDGSSGVITAVSGSTFTVASLTGGSNNTWAVGDNFNVMAGEYGVVTSWDADESYIFTTDYGVITGVTQENNVYLEFFRRPVLLQFTEQYPEIPPDYHQYLPDNVVWHMKRTAPKGSGDYNEAMSGRQAFLEGIGDFDDLDDSMIDNATMDFNL